MKTPTLVSYESRVIPQFRVSPAKSLHPGLEETTRSSEEIPIIILIRTATELGRSEYIAHRRL